MNDKKILLKDSIFNRPKVERISAELQKAYPSFKKNQFVTDVMSKFPELELKARISWITVCLEKYLPKEYKRAVKVLIKALPVPNNPDLSDNDYGDFIYAAYADFVAKNGCKEEYLQFSLDALYEMTQRFSAEDSIRYFLNLFPKQTLKKILSWTNDSHYHVRRLCSEGTRPKLPWSQKINIPILVAIPILDRLFSDKTRYVTRSVANHINDISKIDPKLAINTLKRWRKSRKQNPKEMEYIIRHALRTLIKEGNPKAMNLLGFSDKPKVAISNFFVPRKVKMNTALEFKFSITSKEDTNVIIDYALYFQNKAGKLNSKKVFKLTKLLLAKNRTFSVGKSHMLLEHMTTRKLFYGKHEVEIKVNGNFYGKKDFQLV